MSKPWYETSALELSILRNPLTRTEKKETLSTENVPQPQISTLPQKNVKTLV